MSNIQRALISVSDKQGVVQFAKHLTELGVEILSTGGTAKLLQAENIKVTEVSEHTGFPEMMDGRVKTLHPRIHGGILGRRGIDDKVMQENNITPIDLVVVNLYPFAQAIADPTCSFEHAIENIDIGGPTLLRAAAKNHTQISVVVNPGDYPLIIEEMKNNAGTTSEDFRFKLAVKAFEHTAKYDGAIANYLGSIEGPSSEDRKPQGFSQTINFQFNKAQEMRYGENPHQAAAFYTDPSHTGATVASAKQSQGKELSYNNIADTDAALECVKQFDPPACVIVKHANPCGVAIRDDLEAAYQAAYSTDPTSAFGGIIAFNRPLDEATAKAIIGQQFVEVIIAPSIETKASEILQSKPNIRVLSCGQWQNDGHINTDWDFKRVTGGLLVQNRDTGMIQANQLKIVTQRKPTEEELIDLLFTWKVAKFVKSNAIVYGKQRITVGVGAGQMSRVYSARIAAIKAADANLQVSGAVMASDAFFPFRDGLDSAADVGITAVIQPGGSMRDDEVIAAADEHNIAMVFTGMRHFRH